MSNDTEHFVYPSDSDRAESDELNRVCEHAEALEDEIAELRSKLDEKNKRWPFMTQEPALGSDWRPNDADNQPPMMQPCDWLFWNPLKQEFWVNCCVAQIVCTTSPALAWRPSQFRREELEGFRTEDDEPRPFYPEHGLDKLFEAKKKKEDEE